MLNPPPIPDLLAELATFQEWTAYVAADDGLDWTARPSQWEWSLTEIACHLRDVEREVHQARIQALLEADGAFLAGVDADEWAGPRNYRAQDGRAALVDFLAARAETIALLSPLPVEIWQRQGQHTFFGPTSLHEIVYLAVQHDRLHARQIDELTRGEPGESE
jgi:hypothetical protein